MTSHVFERLNAQLISNQMTLFDMLDVLRRTLGQHAITPSLALIWSDTSTPGTKGR